MKPYIDPYSFDPPAAAAKIEEFFGKSLPQNYRTWLLDATAPYLAPAKVNIPNESPWIDRIECFYAAQEILKSLLQELELRRNGGPRSFPHQMVPVGEGYGDFYLISLRDGNYGNVYFQFHETAHPGNDFQDGLIHLANSFTEWLPTLVPVDGEDE